jgi:DNA-binding beta-propeller fold protein YncE
MSHTRTITMALATVIAVFPLGGSPAQAQTASPNDLPNPYRTVENRFKLPEGRTWGAISAVDIDKDGRSIWIAERCGGNSGCPANPTVDPVLMFDTSGKLVKSFGAGLIMSPHGIHVDREGNVWVTDYGDNIQRAPRGGAPDGGAGRGRGGAPGRGPGGPVGAAAGATKGHQVLKFSPDGKLLLALGTAGGASDPGYFYQPNDVLVAPNGDIFVSQGHGGGGRILKFDKSGTFIKQFGKSGSGPGEFNVPHALAMDSRGRLFIGDRGNNRVQILDQDGNFIEEWKQFGRPSGLFIDKNDLLYVADSESDDTRNPGGLKRGIRIGNVRDGKVTALIPDPWTAEPRPATTSPEGIAVDDAGNIYGVEVTETDVKQYVKK